MRFLVDMQLPPRLCAWLEQHGHTAIHASELPDGATLPDAALWEHAGRDGCVLVSKDTDFWDLMLLRGSPPQLIYIALGNCSNVRLAAQLEYQWDDISTAIQAGASMVAVYASRLRIYD